MALNAATLGGEIKSAIEGAFGEPQDDAELAAFCDAIAQAIVDHIVANAVVTATGSDPQGGSVNSTGTVA